MPETFGKRQRQTVKQRKQSAREERRVARNQRRDARESGQEPEDSWLGDPNPTGVEELDQPSPAD
ncbi:MAG: hypothetical protein ABR600_10785 [Actinomycetota bacterium]